MRESTLVLVAEDDDDLRRLIAQLLRLEGYRVIEVGTGIELLALITSADAPRVDVIVSDIRMPGFTGLEVLTYLRLVGERIPVVLMTAFCGHEVDEAARRLQATVLSKPFDVDDMLAVIQVASQRQ